MGYFYTTINSRVYGSLDLTPKEANMALLGIAAQGGSLAAMAAFEAVEKLPEDARQAEVALAAIGAASQAVNEDWQNGAGLASTTILMGQRMRLAYKSVGRFRAIEAGGGTVQVVILAEDQEDAESSWHQRFPDKEAKLKERSAEELAQDGLGILL